jgi:epoxyqueuosine reductase
MDPAQATALVRQLAREVGFARVGIAAIDSLPADVVEGLRSWIRAGRHAGMHYLPRHLEVRTDPSRLLEGARNVICLATSYAHEYPEHSSSARIARYAHGRDYHKVLKKRCHALMDRLGEEFPSFQGRALVDSAPIMERTFGVLAGLGWIGSNGCLHVPGLGSWVLLAEVVTNLPLEPDEPIETLCDRCGACLRACPSGALQPDGIVEAALCISYLNKDAGEVPEEQWEAMGLWIFGCDACQEACSRNGDLPAGDDVLVGTRRGLDALTIQQVLSWSREDFERITAGTPVRRAGYERVLRNAVIAAGNSGQSSLGDAVRAVGRREVGLRRQVEWALWRLGLDDDV